MNWLVHIFVTLVGIFLTLWCGFFIQSLASDHAPIMLIAMTIIGWILMMMLVVLLDHALIQGLEPQASKVSE